MTTEISVMYGSEKVNVHSKYGKFCRVLVCNDKYYLLLRTLDQQVIQTCHLKNSHSQDDMDECCLVILALSRRNLSIISQANKLLAC